MPFSECLRRVTGGPRRRLWLPACSVFQLPQRLRVAIDAKAYALAVDCYISARPVLKRAGYKVNPAAFAFSLAAVPLGPF